MASELPREGKGEFIFLSVGVNGKLPKLLYITPSMPMPSILLKTITESKIDIKDGGGLVRKADSAGEGSGTRKNNINKCDQIMLYTHVRSPQVPYCICVQIC